MTVHLFAVTECVTCGQPIATAGDAWRCCPEHTDTYGADEWECADCVSETHMRMTLRSVPDA